MGQRSFPLLALLLASALPGVASAMQVEAVCVFDQVERPDFAPPMALGDVQIADVAHDVIAIGATVEVLASATAVASDAATSAELEGTTDATRVGRTVATMQSRRAPTPRSRSMLAEHLPMKKSRTSLDVTRSHAHQGRGPLTFYRSRG